MKLQVFDSLGSKIVDADIIIIDHGVLYIDDQIALRLIDGLWTQNDGVQWPRISIIGGCDGKELVGL